MIITVEQLIIYISALVILFLTPGPVWVAILARTVSGGAKSAISLTLGVSLGDFFWPIIVFFGLGFVISIYSDFLILIHYLASLILVFMGIQIILTCRKMIKPNNQLIRSGFLSGFSAGFFAVIANPKASLFYLTFLPSFFDFNQISILDIFIISTVSFFAPMCGNLFIILLFSKARNFLTSRKSIKITNIISGILLIVVGIVIAFR